MDYKRHYTLLIQKYQDLNLKKEDYPSGSLERHHILPKSLGGDNSRDNLVLLTAKAHFVAHHLLSKIHGDKMIYAFWRMCQPANGMRIGTRISSVVYESARLARSVAMRGNKNALGSRHSEETKQKIREANSGENHHSFGKVGKDSHVYGLKRSDETKQKISEGNKGKKRSEACRDKMRVKNSGTGNPSHNPTVFLFQHTEGDQLLGTSYELRLKYNLPSSGVSSLSTGRFLTFKGWEIISIPPY